MAFSITNAAKKGEKKVKEEVLPIFERSKKAAIWKMSHDRNVDADIKQAGSIQQAKGRYVDGPAYDPSKTSYNWKVPQGKKSKLIKNRAGLKIAPEEKVLVSIKAGGRRVACLDDPVNGTKNQKEVEVSSNLLVQTLEGMLNHLKQMKKDDDTGRKFHHLAIQAAKPKKTKNNPGVCAYDVAKDQWKTFQGNKDSSATKLRADFVNKPANRDSRYNK
jgi:hypothetical protein